MRIDGRQTNQLREIRVTPGFTSYAEGSVLIEFGKTRILCTASVEPNVPKWLHGTQKGWVTAEYGMLPRSTHTRIHREKAMSSGRTLEISRLIARSLRAVTDLTALGEKSIVVDCDVIQADGGTRTAAITGGFIALAFALNGMKLKGEIAKLPLKDYVSAVSVGIADSGLLLDLKFEEDSSAGTDMNVVMTGSGNFVEVQGTAEGDPFSQIQLTALLELARGGCNSIFEIQEGAIGSFFPRKR